VSSLQPPDHAGSLLGEFSTLKMEAIRSSETSVYTISTRRRTPEDGILHVASRLKSAKEGKGVTSTFFQRR
jgi:hypothetical protein